MYKKVHEKHIRYTATRLNHCITVRTLNYQQVHTGYGRSKQLSILVVKLFRMEKHN